MVKVEENNWNPLDEIEALKASYPKTMRIRELGIRIRPRFDSDGRVAREELSLIRMQLAGATMGFMRHQFIEWYMRDYVPRLGYDLI